MRSPIRAFVFDLGGTLLEYEGLSFSWADWYEEAFQQVSLALELHWGQSQIEAAIAILKKYNARINPREIEYSAEHIFTQVLQALGTEHLSATEMACHFYRHFQKRVRVFSDAVGTLQYLREKGYSLGILTDVPTGMPEALVLEDVGVLGRQIDRVLTSVEAGFRKPHRAGLDQLAREFGVAPTQMVYVGDEEKDIQAAKKVGATAIWINRPGNRRSYGEDYQIRELSGLKEWVSANVEGG